MKGQNSRLWNADAVRRSFPLLSTHVHGKPLVYLDNGATSQKPQFVLDKLDHYWKEANANIHRGVYHLSQYSTELYDNARKRVQIVLNADESSEIVFTKGCTEAINLVASSYGRLVLGGGDEILVSRMEHHSNMVPWQLIARERGALVKPIEITDEGDIDLDDYRQKLASGRVKLVAIVHISNSLGTVNPIAEMVSMAHDAGAVVLVDGAQAGPHTLIDVQALGADFYTLSCHKMYAPTGVGVLYGKRQLLEAMPPYQGGGDMIRVVSFEGTTFADIPAKFEAGTPNIAGVVGLGAAIDYILSHGEGPSEREMLADAFARISRHEDRLLARAIELLSEIESVQIIGVPRQRAGLVSFAMRDAHPHDVGTILDTHGVAVRAGHHCCMPLMKRLGLPATTRASFGMYNTEADVEALSTAVRKVEEIFA